MKPYSDTISLVRNSRGIYCLDTSMGCSSGMATSGGCYNDCYAAKSAKLYGYDFSTTVLRKFKSKKHEREIIRDISRIKLDFVRIGCSGDPSEDWQHTLDIIKVISKANKEIVIITKHWTVLSNQQLDYLSGTNLCINTSVSALDHPDMLHENISQYNRIKSYCKSVLRIVSCDFNLNNDEGLRMSHIQAKLFKNEDTIDTIFRPSKTNPLVTNGVINTSKGVFNGHKALMSKYNRKTYAGKCAACKEMCGVSINSKHKYANRPGVVKQLSLI